MLQEADRFFEFVSTGGEGSTAGFWLDDNGKQWIAHHGSGSGSDWWGLISDDPMDLLKLIAIGYGEPAFYEYHGHTVEESFQQDFHDGPINPPIAFQKELKLRFGIDTPKRASDFLPYPAQSSLGEINDPFANWLFSICG